MNFSVRSFGPTFVAVFATLLCCAVAQTLPESKAKQIPEPLKPWEGWVMWGEEHRNCPTPYHDPKKHLCFWPSRLALQVDPSGGRFEIAVVVFNQTWVPLPGSQEIWPLEVKSNGAPLVVVEHDGRPSAQLEAGTYRLEGTYRWNTIPQRLPLPREIGLIALTIEGKPVEFPAWDAEGFLWLKRDGASEATDKDFLSVKAYAVLEDGIPLWLRTEVELIVSGKSREEDLGTILPEGWKLAAIDSPIPVAVDETGRMKAQVRAGKWTVHADAFRLDNPTEFRFPQGAKPVVAEELIAFRSKPDFRMVEIIGAPSIDVSQTTFPEKWRELPVYRWDTATPFRIEERMRGMGLQKPAGLTIARQLWLDENGRGLTFRDAITGQMQQIWRLDAAPGQDLGSVRCGGQGQLITRNPQTGAPGIEIRTREIDMTATGRMNRTRELSATGWRSDADSLQVTLNLPPGWRLFALFGADWVRGDWLTAWTLLDLFLLLLFTLAVFRLWGPVAAVLAFLAFGLSYHEAGAPRFIWLVLLIPLALLRYVPEGWGHRLLVVSKWLVIGAFVLILVPFVASQVQQCLYPQLEKLGGRRVIAMSAAPDFTSEAGEVMQQPPASAAAGQAEAERGYTTRGVTSTAKPSKAVTQKDNLQYDAKARIQTGPGVPEWSWRTVSFGWDGPVLASQQVRPVLISQPLERVLTVLRIVLVLALAAILLNARSLGSLLFRRTGKAAALLALIFWLGAAKQGQAQQVPNQATLDTLRERLLQPSDAYPNAAAIPSVSLVLNDRRVVIDAEIHCAIKTAVPLPGRLPAWSPLSVLVDGKPEAALRRDDGYVWIALPAGVHRVQVEGMLPNVTDWQWTFLLKPHRVMIDAPGWTVSGVRPDGVPEQQVFFALKQKSAAGEASYDRQDLQTVAAVERHLELGLVWQIRTTVTRLSPTGRALALRVPLLPGENVLTSTTAVRDGFIEIRLGANETAFTWESGLAVAEHLTLATRPEDTWVERWYLVASPIWNVAIAGLQPIFEAGRPELIPVWQPWPGEKVELTISRPEAISGATVTVSRGSHEINLGKRQRASKLDLAIRSSLGEDFLIDLPADAEITSLTHNGKSIPARRDGARLIVPLRPGEQMLSLGWKLNGLLGMQPRAEEVKLPVESANIKTTIQVPDDRWVLWAYGPLQGPAVRFWGILICSLLAAWVLGQLTSSPLRPVEWMLLVIGLTQVPLPAALLVIGWFFFLVWRGSESFLHLPPWRFNVLQVILIGLTAIALGVLIVAVGEGLLGSPEMFISGNGSSRTFLRWYQARCDNVLPRPGCISVSIWWYRFLMLAWAMWLAFALIRWLSWGWRNFGKGGFFHRKSKESSAPPPLPAKG